MKKKLPIMLTLVVTSLVLGACSVNIRLGRCEAEVSVAVKPREAKPKPEPAPAPEPATIETAATPAPEPENPETRFPVETENWYFNKANISMLCNGAVVEKEIAFSPGSGHARVWFEIEKGASCSIGVFPIRGRYLETSVDEMEDGLKAILYVSQDGYRPGIAIRRRLGDDD